MVTCNFARHHFFILSIQIAASGLGIGHQSPADGARTPVWLATEPIGQQVSGQYFEKMHAVPDPFTTDKQAVEALYQACLQY